MYSGKMDRMGPAVAAASPFRFESVEKGSLAMELRDTVLFSRTSVCASEKAVPHRGGGSITAAGAGRCIMFSAGWGRDGEVLAAAESIATVVGGIVAEVDLLPSGLVVLASRGVRLPALGGKSRDTESIEGLGPGVLFIWFLDGGLSLGKREKAPPCGGPADMVFYFLSRIEIAGSVVLYSSSYYLSSLWSLSKASTQAQLVVWRPKVEIQPTPLSTHVCWLVVQYKSHTIRELQSQSCK